MVELLKESAMYRARKRRKGGSFSEMRLWGLFRRRNEIREQYCQKCGRRFIETPIPKPDEHFVQGSAAALIYTGKRYGRKEFTVQVGRWQSSGREMYLSHLLTDHDLSDLTKVAAMAQKYIGAHSNKLERKRR